MPCMAPSWIVFILICFTAHCHLPLMWRFVTEGITGSFWWLAAGPLNPARRGFYRPIVLLKAKQSSPTMGQWGSVSPLIREAQSLYSSALHQRLNEHRFSSKSHHQAGKQTAPHFGFVNNWIFMTMVLSLVSKNQLCPVAPLLLNLGSTFRHITLAGLIKTRRVFLCRMRIIIFQQSGPNGFHNSVPQSQSSLATAGCDKQQKTFLVPVTHFYCVSFFCPCWPSMNSEVGFASRGLDTLGCL